MLVMYRPNLIDTKFYSLNIHIIMLFLYPIPFNPHEKISEYYVLGDLVCNRDAYNKRIYEQYLFDQSVQDNLKLLATSLLDFLCAEVRAKIHVERAYLHPRLAKFEEFNGETYQYGYGALLKPVNGEQYDKIWQVACELEHDLNVSRPGEIYVSIKPAFNQRINRVCRGYYSKIKEAYL